MQMTPETLVQLLEELSEWLEFEDVEPVEWVVCGGVALVLQNLQLRTTRDVDVLGSWNSQGAELVRIEEFPAEVESCIERVIDNHPEFEDLSKRWINLGPARLAQVGLPAGFERRLTTRTFGKRLTLYLLGRDDLLALKLYASADEFSPRQDIHFEDLRVLDPNFKELERAVDWMRTLPDFEQVRTELKDVVDRLGYDVLAYYV